VNGYSLVKAGLTLLALLLSSPFATAVAGVLSSSCKVPPIYLILSGAVLQTIGMGLTINLPPTGGTFAKEQYAYEVVMGLGFGLILATVLTLAQLVCDEKYFGIYHIFRRRCLVTWKSNQSLGLMMGALTQVRVMGRTVSLAIW
jgi:hypothetical protein